MSRRRKAAALARKAITRKPQDHTSHLTALRNVADQPAVAVDPDLPLFAETVRRCGFVPTPSWAAGTQLLPVLGQVSA